MWVVKIGGSLETAPGLSSLLTLLVDYGHSRIIIVSGGGRFADQVRAEQPGAAMDDVTAHRLAIQGMEQYADILCGMNKRLYPVADASEICSTGGESTVPVWLPSKLLDEQPDIPANWQVTSDSLALWFAGKINAEALMLVKSAPNQTNNAQELAAVGYLDKFFPQMIARTRVKKIACVSIDNLEILQQAMISGIIPAQIWVV